MAIVKKQRKRSKKSLENISLAANKQSSFEKQVASLRKKIKIEPNEPVRRGVVYLGHIPHGFYESQMRDYFSQFGDVRRLRISRSKYTTKMRGYAFIEFESEDVAKIVADTMNNYLMFEHVLKCEFIPPGKIHASMFKNCWRRITPDKKTLIAKRHHNSFKSPSKVVRAKKRASQTLLKTKEWLAAIGIEFNTDLVLHGKSEDMKNSTPKPKPDKDKEQLMKEATPQHVLEIDSSDEEITFKTPPNTIKKAKVKKGKSLKSK